MRRSIQNFNLRPVTLCPALLLAVTLMAQARQQPAKNQGEDDPDARPPVTQTDVQIVQRAGAILGSPSKWNRSDNRVCPKDARTFSIYCALEKATIEVTGDFKHRGAAMQEARFVIDDIAPNRGYNHRLMDYNNDPTTSFADVQRVFQLLDDRITSELSKKPPSGGQK